jgi:hypothetical protein
VHIRFSILRFPALAAALLLGGATACTEDRDPILPPDAAAAGREYYPMATGRFWEYDVEEHRWELNLDSVVRFQLRERVDTVYTGATGETTYRIVRSRRADSLAVWRDDSAAAVIVRTDLIHRTFANQPTLELLFPIAEGKQWNPNLFNAADSTFRMYSSVGQSFTMPNQRAFAKTVLVTDEANVTAVERKETQTRYAWDVGRVYRHRINLSYCNQSDVNQGLCMIGTNYIVRGTERIEQLRKWGR